MLRKILLLALCWAVCQSYDYVYMKDRCGELPYVISYDADKIWYSAFGYNVGQCVFTIKGSSRLILNFYLLESSIMDEIYVYDGSSTNSRTLTSTYLSGYDYSPSYSYRSSGPYLTIRFVANSQSFSNTGFKAVATQIISGDCSLDYKCCDGDCIDSTLRWDGVDNCRDSSDEWDVSGCLNTGTLVGVVVGVSLFSTFCILVLVCFVRRRRLRRAQAIVVTQSGYPNYSSTTYVQPAPIYNQAPPPQGGAMQPHPPQGGAMQAPPYSQYPQQDAK